MDFKGGIFHETITHSSRRGFTVIEIHKAHKRNTNHVLKLPQFVNVTCYAVTELHTLMKIQTLSQTASTVSRFVNFLLFCPLAQFPHDIWAWKISFCFRRVSPEIVYLKRKGKMADDNVSAVKSHKMALDKEKARFYSDSSFLYTPADQTSESQ